MIINLKMEKMSQKALERKSQKPIMEKKRRARINDCLNQLKALVLETDSDRSRHSKLEKADILEMTVRYLQTLRTYHIQLEQLHQIQQQQQQQQLCPTPPGLRLPLQLQPLQQLTQLQHQAQIISPTWRPW